MEVIGFVLKRLDPCPCFAQVDSIQVCNLIDCKEGSVTFPTLLECGCSGTDAECPIGDCECEGQVRINNDCTYAKLVHNNFPSSSNDYDFLEFVKK